MDWKTIEIAQRGPVATVMLNRPERQNSWTGRMHLELRTAFAELDENPNVRAIVLTGAGNAFCPGGDFGALDTHAKRGSYDAGTPPEMPTPGEAAAPEFRGDFAWMMGLSKPVIGAINGAAAGIGLALACFCDIKIVRSDAKFTTAHGRLNLPAEFGLSWILPRAMGLTQAMDLLLTSRVFTGEEGVQLGLFNRAEPDAEAVRTAAYDYALGMVEGISPGSLKATRHQTYLDQHRGVADAIADSKARLEEMMREDDYREGLKALMEKRKPEWQG
ncbi:MAG: enoyl-CoA hydratase-related protein [Alphaproteobacteria bacterium]